MAAISMEETSPVSPTAPSGARLMDKQWATVQTKTFTKWVNTQLEKGGRPVITQSLANDFSDGVRLLELLEVIGNESLGKYYKAPKLRVQKCENMNRALHFIKERGVSLTNIGAEDLVDKNEKLVLGMIWTIILRFTIAEINTEGLTAKEGLLLWCQRKTAGYQNVNVKDFTYSWTDGLALCALIHRHRPDLLDFDKLDPKNRRENVKLAFDIAADCIGIPKLLDVEDLVDMPKPDERSVMTYVAQYFHAFSALDKVEVAGRRVGKFALVIKAAWEMQNDYETRARNFVDSLKETTEYWARSSFDGTYADAKKQLQDFQEYKSSAKRKWVAEKRELDTLLSNINTKLRTYNLALYNPPEGLSVVDVDRSWRSLIEQESARRKSINDKILEIKEALKMDYCSLANAFESTLNSLSAALGGLDGDLQEQLEMVQSLASKVAEHESRLAEISVADEKCHAAGIDETEREATVFSVDDLSFDLGLVKVAIQKKKAFIENQIAARNVTNLTPQQLEEFESAFKAFDKDNSNSLASVEFKACLASLGKDYEEEEFKEIFESVAGSDSASVKFEQFLQFMVSITEDRTTIDQLVKSFRDIANGKKFITEQDMLKVQISPEQVDYLKSVMPKSADSPDGYDFEAYLKQAFA